MNGSSKPVWSVLTAKAEQALRHEQNKRDIALSKKKDVLQRKDKIDTLLIEYSNRLTRVLERSHSQEESRHYRQFIIHLHNLRDRTSEELEQHDGAYKIAQKQVIVADEERLKLSRLDERVQNQERKEEQRRENKEFESQGLTQFNLNSRS
jgi:flagellar export protein FliJ